VPPELGGAVNSYEIDSRHPSQRNLDERISPMRSPTSISTEYRLFVFLAVALFCAVRENVAAVRNACAAVSYSVNRRPARRR
jgi:hypothetical protein